MRNFEYLEIFQLNQNFFYYGSWESQVHYQGSSQKKRRRGGGGVLRSKHIGGFSDHIKDFFASERGSSPLSPPWLDPSGSGSHDLGARS